MKKTLLFAIVVFAALHSAQAQTQVEAQRFLVRFEKIQDELFNTRAALIDMRSAMRSDVERNPMDLFIAASEDASDSANLVTVVASIYTLMIDKRDQEVVTKSLVMQSKYAISKIDLSISTINRSLPSVRSVAVMSEVKSARSQIQGLKDELDKIIGK